MATVYTDSSLNSSEYSIGSIVSTIYTIFVSILGAITNDTVYITNDTVLTTNDANSLDVKNHSNYTELPIQS